VRKVNSVAVVEASSKDVTRRRYMKLGNRIFIKIDGEPGIEKPACFQAAIDSDVGGDFEIVAISV